MLARLRGYSLFLALQFIAHVALITRPILSENFARPDRLFPDWADVCALDDPTLILSLFQEPGVCIPVTERLF